MRRSLALVVLATLALVLGCNEGLGGRGYTPRIGEIIDVAGELRIDLPGRVSLLIQVVDQRGNPLPGLTADDFALFENDEPISPSEAQQQLLPLPRVYQLLSVLLLDLSSSISGDPEALAAEIEAAKAYVDLVTQDPSSRISILFFYGIDDVVPAAIEDPVSGQFRPLGFSNDPVSLYEALDNVDRIEVFDDRTNLYGAVIQAADELEDEAVDVLAEGEVEFISQALVTFTDGGHNANDITLEEAVAAIEDITAFSIGVGTEIDREALQALGPDGSVFVESLEDLVDSFEEVGRELSDEANSFYRVAYLSQKSDGSRNPDLRVEAIDDERVFVETSYSTRYFGAGAGFIVPLATDANLDFEGTCETVAVGAVGDSFYLLREPTGVALAVGHALADGSLDPDFGERGVAYLAADDVGDDVSLFAVGLAVSPVDGTATVLAQRVSNTAFESNILVARLDETGAFEVVNLPAGLSGDLTLVDRGMDITIDDAGRTWIGGSSSGATGSRRLLVRLTTALELDGDFGTGGVVTHVTVPAAPIDEIVDVVLDGDRALTVGVGFNSARGGPDLQIVAFDDEGELDATWGTGGVVDNWALFEGSALDGIGVGNAGLVDPVDGGLVVAGSTSLRSATGQQLESAAFWRLDADGVPDEEFLGGFSNPFGPGGDYPAPGIVTLGDPLTANPDVGFGRGSWLNAVALRADGSLLAAGGRSNAQSHDDAVWMNIQPDGLLRAAYNGTGFFIDDGAIFDDGDEEIYSIALLPDGPTLSCGSASTPGSLTGMPLLFRDEDTRRD